MGCSQILSFRRKNRNFFQIHKSGIIPTPVPAALISGRNRRISADRNAATLAANASGAILISKSLAILACTLPLWGKSSEKTLMRYNSRPDPLDPYLEGCRGTQSLNGTIHRSKTAQSRHEADRSRIAIASRPDKRARSPQFLALFPANAAPVFQPHRLG